MNLIPWCWPMDREDEAGEPIHLAELEEHEEWCRCEDPEAPGCPCPCEDCEPPHEEGAKDTEVRRLSGEGSVRAMPLKVHGAESDRTAVNDLDFEAHLRPENDYIFESYLKSRRYDFPDWGAWCQSKRKEREAERLKAKERAEQAALTEARMAEFKERHPILWRPVFTVVIAVMAVLILAAFGIIAVLLLMGGMAGILGG